MAKLQKKPSAPKENTRHLKFLNFFYFVGNFCPPGSGSGLRIRIRFHGPDRILIRSGCETLVYCTLWFIFKFNILFQIFTFFISYKIVQSISYVRRRVKMVYRENVYDTTNDDI
jgi:hypothetical protein